MESFIPVNTPLLNGNEKKYLNECIDTGWISSEGPFIKKFEEEFAKKMGRKYAVAVCNGTAAIDCAVESLSLKPGDEVIVPTFTIISCISHILRAGLIPVFVDCDQHTWNMNPSDVERAITTKTKAIMIVHIYGLPVDVDPILNIAKTHGLYVIEDAAEMHGQTYRSKPCGSFGNLSTFSFYPNKHITTGEGGMVVTDDRNLYEKCLSLRNLCFLPEKRFYHEDLGWNLRMTNMQAALGLAQLERLDEFVVKKRKIGKLYSQLLQSLKDRELIQLPIEKTEFAENIYWVYAIVLKEKAGITAEAMMRKLAELGVGTRPFFYPLHKQPILKKMGITADIHLPISERVTKYGFYLPSGLGLDEKSVHIVVEKLTEALS